jgi:hypothetical protein
MSYVFPGSFDGGYSGPFHDYYLYGDFDAAIPTTGSAGDRSKAFITGVNPNSALSNISPDLSALALKPRRYNEHAWTGSSARKDAVEDRGGTGNYSSYISWNSGYKSTLLISRRHVVSTRHGTQDWNTDMGYGVGPGGGSIYQFMEKNGNTFNVEVEQAGIAGSGNAGAAYINKDGTTFIGVTSGTFPSAEAINPDIVVFRLTERISEDKDVTIARRFIAKEDIPSATTRSSKVVFNSNGIMRFTDDLGSIRRDRNNTPLNVPLIKWACDSGSVSFYNHKTEGTIFNTKFASGFDLYNAIKIGNINEFLAEEGEEPLTLLEESDLSTSNGGFYDYTEFNIPLVGTEQSFTPNSFDNNKKVKVTVIGTRADGTKTKPFTKEIQIAATGNIPPNFTNLSDPVESNLNLSNSLYCSPGIDGVEIDSNYGSYYLGFTTDQHPLDTSLYGIFGVTNSSQLDVSYGTTLDSEFSETIEASQTQTDSSGVLLSLFGGSNFTGFKGIAHGIVFPSEIAGQTVYVRPRIQNVLGTTQGDWYEVGRAITAGRGPTFTSFSFDTYGPTAGATMIGTAACYTAIPDIGRNKIAGLFGLGGLTVADIQINGTVYGDGTDINFSGGTFAMKIPSDCPEGASLGILVGSIDYRNVYGSDVNPTFPGSGSGFTLINVGGS